MTITLHIDGQPHTVPAGCNVSAALAHAGLAERAAPFCGMGQCQACRVTIDGIAQRLACMTPAVDGMTIATAPC